MESVADVKKFFSNTARRSFICKAGVNEDVFENYDYFLLQLDNYSDEIYNITTRHIIFRIPIQLFG